MKRIFLLAAVFLPVLFMALILVTSQSLTSKKITTSTFAAPVCHPLCKTEPPCCAEILRRADAVGDEIYDLPDDEQPYHACDWDEGNADYNYRGYCKRSTCDQLPAGVKYRGHCGWYWNYQDGHTNSPDGYGCMIGDASNMRPICDGGTGPVPTATPQPGVTNPPTTTGVGILKIQVHKDTAQGDLWDGDGEVDVYITGPTARGSFGELLTITGEDSAECFSRGGFPFQCKKGTAIWKGADGKSGTSPGSYTATIENVPDEWEAKNNSKTGTLSAGDTLTLDLVIKNNEGGNPTATPGPTATMTPTPPPGSTATPTPTNNPNATNTPTPTQAQNQIVNSQNPIGTIVRTIVSNSPVGSSFESVSQTPIGLQINNALLRMDELAVPPLTVTEAFFQQVQSADIRLESAIRGVIQNIEDVIRQ